MEATTTLSEALMEKIRDAAEKAKSPELYWDYRDGFELNTINKAITDTPDFPMETIYDAVNDDAVYDTEIEFIQELISDFDDDIEKELGEGYDEKSLARELRDDLLDFISVDYNLKQPLNFQVPIRLEVYSNYDCINSHWLEHQSPYSMESYFGDVVRVLQLNPAEVKKWLISHGGTTEGAWRNLPKKKPLVDLKEFWVEMENRCCPVNLLTFLGTINAYELLENYSKDATVIIPKGNPVSFFSSCHGGGSIFEAKLLRDLKIDLGKTYDKAKMLSYSLHIDCYENKYSIVDAYGTDKSFFGDNIEVIK